MHVYTSQTELLGLDPEHAIHGLHPLGVGVLKADLSGKDKTLNCPLDVIVQERNAVYNNYPYDFQKK